MWPTTARQSTGSQPATVRERKATGLARAAMHGVLVSEAMGNNRAAEDRGLKASAQDVVGPTGKALVVIVRPTKLKARDEVAQRTSRRTRLLLLR